VASTRCPRTGKCNGFTFNDDGTVDIVVICSECGEELQYTYQPPEPEEVPPLVLGGPGENMADDEIQMQFDEFVRWATRDASERHEKKESKRSTNTVVTPC
jgi:hypothetical protein